MVSDPENFFGYDIANIGTDPDQPPSVICRATLGKQLIDDDTV